MSNIIVSQLEKIQSPLWKAFAFRTYNVLKSIILPIVIGMTYIQLQNNPNDLSFLGEKQYWLNVLYSVLLAILGSAVAGLEKVNRERKEG